MEPLKRGRTATSSLIPFPRVGRSVSDGEDAEAGSYLYGQKRTGKSSLIPFPRVGRRSDPLWQSHRGTLKCKIPNF